MTREYTDYKKGQLTDEQKNKIYKEMCEEYFAQNLSLVSLNFYYDEGTNETMLKWKVRVKE